MGLDFGSALGWSGFPPGLTVSQSEYTTDVEMESVLKDDIGSFEIAPFATALRHHAALITTPLDNTDDAA